MNVVFSVFYKHFSQDDKGVNVCPSIRTLNTAAGIHGRYKQSPLRVAAANLPGNDGT